ncbi:hypothetical protein [Pseudomonas sp. JZ134]|uniref:hypothetical protein n=1 Tax=Pseudomonas sp. JZ134 TaxID=2806615 RepID=UPI003DA091EF
MKKKVSMLPPGMAPAAPTDQPDNQAIKQFIQGAPDSGKAVETEVPKKKKKREPVTMLYPSDLLERVDDFVRNDEVLNTRTAFVMQAIRNELKRLQE